jgi:two-component system, LytTR family, response regulator
MRAFLVDDEPLALKRLARMLAASGRVKVVGSSSDPVEAIVAIQESRPDLLFLDIQMPGLNGFEMLARLDPQPLVIFTTAFDQYALDAFAVNSVDYLLKPIEAAQLERALNKIERIRGGADPAPDLRDLLSRMTPAAPDYPGRIASRTGERVEFVELARITHFFAADKLTWAATGGKNYPVDHTIQQLEEKLDPKKFVRVHRSTIVNLDYVHELHPWFAGRMLVRLKDEKRTEVGVARERVRVLRERLGI